MKSAEQLKPVWSEQQLLGRSVVGAKGAVRDGRATAVPSYESARAQGRDPEPTNKGVTLGQKPLPSGPSQATTTLHPLDEALESLVRLTANVTEAYTTAIFLSDTADPKVLVPRAVHTLSRAFLNEARIPFGSGLIGWTAENGVRISVCPFEHDSSTLMYYAEDQELKSFIALPVIDYQGKVIGVISCDSKRSYAFAKVTEKILMDCALQVRNLVSLAQGFQPESFARESVRSVAQTVLDEIRAIQTEDTLLWKIATLPSSVIDRESLVVVTLPEPGCKDGGVYAEGEQTLADHRLMDLICREKKVLCGGRSVHALPTDDLKQRSFLSVPFHFLGKECGSVNVLSKPKVSFSADEIEQVEAIAQAAGERLEHLRLRERVVCSKDSVELSSVSWRQLKLLGQELLSQSVGAEEPVLLRFFLNNLETIEKHEGPEGVHFVMHRLVRLVEQLKPRGSIVSVLYNRDILVLSPRSDGGETWRRMRHLIERKGLKFENGVRGRADDEDRISQFVLSGLDVRAAHFGKDGRTVREMLDATRTSASTVQVAQPINDERARNARGEVANSWKMG